MLLLLPRIRLQDDGWRDSLSACSTAHAFPCLARRPLLYLIAAVLGSVAGMLGGWFERITFAATDLSLALPWLFLLLVVRAILPLDVSTFVLRRASPS